MRFAAVETSTQWCSVALWSDGEIASLERFAGQRHSELVLPMLEKLVKNFDRLDAVAFGSGPGSFTGLRIGIGLSWLAIVAAEMLIGGVGIGFFIWDAWNSSRISDIIIAILYVGIVGLLLDRMIVFVGGLVLPEEEKQ